MSKFKWESDGGGVYEFDVRPPATRWNKVAGIYIFAKPDPKTSWRAVYIGQTNDFSERLALTDKSSEPAHEKWAAARLLGATHIHVIVVSKESDRLVLERLLIRNQKPPLNVQET